MRAGSWRALAWPAAAGLAVTVLCGLATARAAELAVGAAALGVQDTPDVVDDPPAVRVEAGTLHTCSVGADRTAECWGTGANLRLGTGDALERLVPTPVVDGSQQGLAGVQSVTAGAAHGCAALADGTARCWGSAANGRLGTGTLSITNLQASPVHDDVTRTILIGVRAVTAGTSHSCALRTGGRVACWGSSLHVGAGVVADTPRATAVAAAGTGEPLTGAVAVSTSATHTCALLADGTLRCWGAGGSGRLGTGGDADARSAVTVLAAPGGAPLGGVRAVSAGSAHTCAALADGTARCWGAGADGRLGDGGTVGSSTPVAVRDAGGATFTGLTDVAAAGRHTCGLRQDGSVWCWGAGVLGRLGNGSTAASVAPVRVVTATGPLEAVVRLSAGDAHTCAVTAADERWCWGAGGAGQLGNGSKSDSAVAVRTSPP